ncbi:unnamed protein product [Parnassius apollo]|uniref:(apollo) hypothetical protein n=1 Tax=Parnassius apollo TaxID=110799 RepID=A0A8S3XVP1_PARAO|nr:unnamed protein product [Parnassius apollo]
MFESSQLNVPPNKPINQNTEPLPYTIVADAAFPLKTYLLKPYSKAKLVNNNPNKIFNYRLSRARRTVENAFGILRARLRVFQGSLQVQPNMADKIVLAACCLHNFLTQDTQETQDTLMDESEVSDGNGLVLIDPLNRNPSQEAIQILRKKYGIKLNLEFTSQCALLPRWSDKWLECVARLNTDPQNHQIGTAAMGFVLDHTLSVYNVQSLRVIDASAIPTQLTGNPQAAIMMVAERGADFIKKCWS